MMAGSPLHDAAERASVDGRNRLVACDLAGVEPRFEEVIFKDDHDVRAFVADRSERRNISAGQKAMGVAMNFPEPGKGGRGKIGGAKLSKSFAQFSHTLLSQARRVVNAPNKQLQIDVREGTKSLGEAYEKVLAEEKEHESDASKFARLREAAPDLATLIDEGKITLADAVSAHRGRIEAAEREKGGEGKRSVPNGLARPGE
jgi:hypothetical protein